MLSNDDWLDALDELSSLSEAELNEMVKTVCEEQLAAGVRRGELEVVETLPDGSRVYQKTRTWAQRDDL